MNKILLIDDEKDVVKSIATVLKLEDEGYEISCAGDGKSGLEIARKIRPDVILLDIMMPHLNGIEVCRSLKSDEEYKSIHIVMLTALGGTEDITKGFSAGADDYVSKPFNFSELLARIKSHLKSKELYDIVKNEEQEKSAILNISRSLALTTDPHETLYTIVSKIAEVVAVKRCSIIYVDIANQKGFVMASDDSKEIKNLEIDVKKYPEIQKIMETGKPIIINDVYNDPILFSIRDILSLIDIKSILGFPIFFKETLIGTLILRTSRREKPFNDREIRFCELTSNLAAAPLKNAYLVELLYKEKEWEHEAKKAAKAELKERKHFFQTILQNIEEGILVLDREFRIQMANRCLLDIFKKEEKEVIGEHCYRLIFGREDRCPDCFAAKTFQAGKPALAYHDSREKDGSSKCMKLYSYPIFDNNGQVCHVIEKIVDISQHRKTEASLRRMKRSIESANYCIIMTDIKGVIHYVNPAFTSITGYSHKEAIGSKAWIFKSNLHPVALYKEMWNTILSGNIWSGEIKDKRKDGSPYYAILNIAPVMTNEGEIEGFVAIQHDITEHKRMEMELANKTELVQLFQEIAVTTSVVSTFEEAMQICIDNVCLYTGWVVGHVYMPNSIGSLDPTGIWYVKNPDQSEAFIKVTEATSFTPEVGLLGRALATKKPVWIEDVTKEPNFSRAKLIKDFPFKFGFAFPVLDGKKVVAILEFFAEEALKPDKVFLEATSTLSSHLELVYKRKRNEEEKKEMQAQLMHSQKMELVGQLAGGVAHEFNNILMALKGYGEAVKAGIKTNNPVKEKANRMLYLINRASTVTKDLLAFSRKRVDNPKIVKLNEIVKDAIKTLPNLLAKDIELVMKFARKNLFVKADKDQIEQVLMNLATNARDAMPDGGRIFIKTKEKEIDEKFIEKKGYGKCGNYAFLTFTDTGYGMDKKTLKKIFEPFFTTKDSGKGTGLGLSTAYKIIKQHNGFINVNSKLGKGTIFEIYFPLIHPAKAGC